MYSVVMDGHDSAYQRNTLDNPCSRASQSVPEQEKHRVIRGFGFVDPPARESGRGVNKQH